MATQNEADLALQFHQRDLLQNKNIAYIAVMLENQQSEHTSDSNFIIEVGVYDLESQMKLLHSSPVNNYGPLYAVPESLLIPSENARALTNKKIKIRIKETSGFNKQTFNTQVRPVLGGCSVGNSANDDAGTFGTIITIQGKTYFISCWHVFVGDNGGSANGIIVQPGVLDGGTIPDNIIGNLQWFSLNNQMDAAIAIANDITLVDYNFMCYGAFSNYGDAQVGQNVKKCGRTTELTRETITSINATLNVKGYPSGTMTFYNQILTGYMSEPGDSGSILITDDTSNLAVGLLFAGDQRSYSAYNPLIPIIDSFKSSL